MKKKYGKNIGLTLIELLIVVAILAIGFEGLFLATALIYKEGSFGAKEMSLRQQLILCSSTLFRDVKNTSEIMLEFGELKNSPDCLILKLQNLSNEKNKPAVVIYRKKDDKLYRELHFKDTSKKNITLMVENITNVNFTKKEGMIDWEIEASIKFREHIKNFKVSSNAGINGGVAK